MNLIKLLKQPHPFIFELSSVILPGILTFLLLIIFQPLGFQQLAVFIRIKFSIILAGIVMLNIILVVNSLKWLLPKSTIQEKWTIGKEVLLFLLILFTISIVIFLFILSLEITEISFIKLFQSVVLKTIMIGIFPTLVLVLYEQNIHQKAQLHQANMLNKEIENKRKNERSPPIKFIPSDKILFHSENGKIVLQLHQKEILFLKSDGNYVEVFYTITPKKFAKKLVRNRLKNLIAVLPKEAFFHCHQRYVVNVHHIISVTGNARNLELKIRNCNDFIPVSRSNASTLTTYLK